MLFFFSSRRRHTRWNCDWSSDVCSSDLNLCFEGPRTPLVDWNLAAIGNPRIELVGWLPSLSIEGGPPPDQLTGPDDEIGRASCRERGEIGVGGRRCQEEM